MSESSRRSGVRSMFDTSDFRKKREGEAVSIRKQKREEQLRKRRQVMTDAMLQAQAAAGATTATTAGMAGAPAGVPGAYPDQQVPMGYAGEQAQGAFVGAQPLNPQFEPVLAREQVPGADYQTPKALVEAFQSEDVNTHIRAATYVRRVLSMEKQPPIDAIINSGCLPYLVRCLTSDVPKLQFEAAWALTNVASGKTEHTHELVKCNAVKPLIDLLASPSWEICEQAVWALGNIAGDGAELRDTLLCMNVMPQLVALIERLLTGSMPVSVVRNSAWALSNMYRGRPSPPLAYVQSGLPVLRRLIGYPDDEVVVDVIWAVSYATECQSMDKPTPSTEVPPVDERIEAVVAAGLLPEIYPYLSAAELSKALPAIRTFGNILTGSSKYTDLVLQLNIIPPFLGLLNRKNRVIRKEVLWGLSNIAAGTADQVQALIASNVIRIANEVITTGEIDLQKEASWLVANATVCGTPEQVVAMVKEQLLLESLTEVLRMPDSRLLRMGLSAVEVALGIGSQLGTPNPYAIRLQELQCDSRLIDLQDHNNDKVYEKAHELLRDYFDYEDDDVMMDDDGLLGDEIPPADGAAPPFGTQQPQQPAFTQPQFGAQGAAGGAQFTFGAPGSAPPQFGSGGFFQ